MTLRPRVWLLTNLPSAYQLDLFSAIYWEGSIDLDVRFMRSLPANSATTEFDYRVLWSPVPASWRDELRLHPRAIWEALLSKHDCYVLSGLYTSITFLICAIVLTIRRKRWVLWLERPRPAASARYWSNRWIRGAWTDWLRGLVLRNLLRQSAQAICIGTAAVEEYASQFDAPREKLLMLPYCCDGTKFVGVAEVQLSAIRKQFDLVGKVVFLYSGQLIERKGVDVLLEAFGRLAETHSNVSLLLLGDGKLREILIESVPDIAKSRTHFVGFVEQTALPTYFGVADVFVFPSHHDGWGVVVNEACFAGLPIITTHAVGAARDLIIDGESGFIVDPNSPEQLCDRMRWFAEDVRRAKAFGATSRRLVEPFSTAHAACRFSGYIADLLSDTANSSDISNQYSRKTSTYAHSSSH